MPACYFHVYDGANRYSDSEGWASCCCPAVQFRAQPPSASDNIGTWILA